MLAREVTALVHGADQVARAEHAASLLFGEDIATLRSTTCWRCSRMCRRRSCRAVTSIRRGSALVDLVARVQLAPSKSEARRLVQSGGVYVNNRRASDPQARVTREQAIGGRLFVLRKGQKQNHLVRLI